MTPGWLRLQELDSAELSSFISGPGHAPSLSLCLVAHCAACRACLPTMDLSHAADTTYQPGVTPPQLCTH